MNHCPAPQTLSCAVFAPIGSFDALFPAANTHGHPARPKATNQSRRRREIFFMSAPYDSTVLLWLPRLLSRGRTSTLVLMSLHPRARDLDRASHEKFLFVRAPAGDISVCLVYPNLYRLGMANLGFQAAYEIFDRDPRVAIDRAFLPDPDLPVWTSSGPSSLLSFENARQLTNF